MLIMGAVLRCLGPILTVAAGVAERDPWLMPAEHKEVLILIFFHTNILGRGVEFRVRPDRCHLSLEGSHSHSLNQTHTQTHSVGRRDLRARCK